MVSVTDSDVADAMHLSGTADLPTGHQHDITAAETLVGTQVEPYADTDAQPLVDNCAVYVAAAFIEGTEDGGNVSSINRESVTLSFDTEAASDEAQDYWSRAKAFDPTGRLATDESGDAGFFEVM